MAEKKSIHEFSTGTPQAQTAFVVDTPNASAESGYVTEKVITSDLGNTLLGTLNYTQALDTESKNIFGAVNELKENSVNFEEESIPDIPERELPYYPSGEYSSLNTTDKHIVGAINEVNSKSNSLFKVREVRLLSDVEVTTQTEYNSNGSSIPHGVVPTEAGYTPIAITNVRAWGYYGSRITLYAWFNDSANSQIAFSAFNAWSNASYQARVNGSCWVLYVKNASV